MGIEDIIELIKKRKWKNIIEKYNINKPIWNSNYLIHYVGITGDEKLYQLLRNKNKSYVDENGNTFLNLLAKNGHISLLEKVIEDNIDLVKIINYDNYSLFRFIYKLEKLTLKILKILNNKKINIQNILSNLDNNQMTDFYFICTTKNLNIIMEIVKNDCNLLYPVKNTFITNICKNFTDSEIITIINENKKNNNIKEVDSKSQLNLLYYTIIHNKYNVTKYLLSLGFDPDFKNISTFNTQLIRISIDNEINKEMKITKLLWETNKIDVNYYDMNGDTLAHYILLFYLKKMDKKLNSFVIDILNYTDTVNILNIDGDSVLHLLAKTNEIDFFNKIKDKKWNIFTKNNDGKSPYDLASDRIKKIMINKLIDDTNKSKSWLIKKEYEQEKIKNDIKLISENNNITFTNFSSHFLSLCCYILYLLNKYKKLKLPSNKFKLKIDLTKDNVNFDNNYTKIYDIEWFVQFNGNDLIIHKDFLKSVKNKMKKCDFLLVFLAMTETISHANFLIIDCKKETLERYEPYGNLSYDLKINQLLQDKISDKLGLKYINVKSTGHQSIANELHKKNVKKGDVGGFCLAWTIWMVEMRMKNDITIDELMSKSIKKMLQEKINFVQFIRNYSNKLGNIYDDFIIDAGIDKKKLHNKYIFKDEVKTIIDHIIKQFNNLKS